MKSGLSSSHFRPVTVTVTRPVEGRMRIAVIGTGGIGAPYGASLAKAGGAQVRYFWAPANLV
jgi:hypothetical protein